MLWPLIEAGVVKLFIFISEGNKAGFTFNRDHVWEVTGDTLNRRQNLQDQLTDGPPETKPSDDKSQKLAAPQRIPCNRPARAEPARLRRPAFRDAPGDGCHNRAPDSRPPISPSIAPD